VQRAYVRAEPKVERGGRELKHRRVGTIPAMPGFARAA
jgi:hypothetical protein